NLEEAGPGAIVAVAKLKETVTGDTLGEDKSSPTFDRIKPLPPVISYAIEPKEKGDEEKVFTGVSRLLEEDETLKLTRDAQTKDMILWGMGQVHLEVTLDKLKRKFGGEVVLKTPKVPYLETIKKKVTQVQGKYKKQSGGRGQYGDAVIDMEPTESGQGFVFEDKIVGGVIPRQYIPAVEKGIAERSAQGILAGYPMVDFKVSLVFGSFHSVDSSEMAFKVAGSLAFQKAAAQAQPTILEPIMSMEIIVPDETMGDVIGDLNSRRGKVLGIEGKGNNQVIKALVPMAEVLRYMPDLKSMTGARGSFTMTMDHYEEVPAHLQEKIIAESQGTED
ncbi:MAG: elongation factor G, partial [Deltaproteobacteria bacterium]|nr:elongation factor G [Deltaproteobacteria bacterium]